MIVKHVITKLEHGIRKHLQNVNILIAYSYKDAVKHILQNDTIHLAILD